MCGLRSPSLRVKLRSRTRKRRYGKMTRTYPNYRHHITFELTTSLSIFDRCQSSSRCTDAEHSSPQHSRAEAESQAYGRRRAEPRLAGGQDPTRQPGELGSDRRRAEGNAGDEQPRGGVHAAREYQRCAQDRGDLPADCSAEVRDFFF